ncbi:hypothetical protein COU58_04505 [Candidatus Pacearchaeota archaeon CG10_big_fil_rev_8_21_14_0_10_32_42]|nr:MAG: hypothetical protein COU58_04505 [Candidatus Pacearchaeota archaeon CG10_big_fil_rev_8_21_14_0_10_32_42]
MQLEQTLGMYQPRVAQRERQQTYFVVGDLENLSASALYAKINKDDYIKSNDRNFNFYHLINPQNFGETELGVQKDGESHEAFKERMRSEGGYRINPTIKSGSG